MKDKLIEVLAEAGIENALQVVEVLSDSPDFYILDKCDFLEMTAQAKTTKSELIRLYGLYEYINHPVNPYVRKEVEKLRKELQTQNISNMERNKKLREKMLAQILNLTFLDCGVCKEDCKKGCDCFKAKMKEYITDKYKLG